jgi:MFS family permease
MSIFKIRNVAGANLIQLTVAASLFSVFFFTTLYVQEILGYSPVKTGVSFLALPIVIAICATNAPHLIKRIGFRPILIVAPLFTATGLFMLGHVPVHGHYFHDLLPGFILMSIGLGFSFVSILVAATSGVAGHLSGLASGLVNTAQQVGGSLGLAILSGIAASSTVRYIAHAGIPTQLTAVAARVHGFQTGYYAAVGFALFASLLAIVVLRKPKQPAGGKSETEPVVAL